MSDLISQPPTPPASSAPAAPATPPAPAAPAPPPSAEQFDDFGYPKAPPEAAPKAEEKPPGDKPKEAPAPEPEKVADPVSGYSGPEPKVEDPPAPAAPVAPPAAADDYDKALEGLPKEELGKIKDFAKKHNVTVDQAKAFGEMRRDELKAQEAAVANFEKEQERLKQQQRATWYKELKADTTFGGENYDHNVLKVEKVLAELMPNTKKVLTEYKAMLPPYVMRDLAKIAEHLFSTEKLVTGNPAVQEVDDKKADDALSYYT